MESKQEIQSLPVVALRWKLAHIQYLCYVLEKYNGPVRLKKRMEVYEKNIREELAKRGVDVRGSFEVQG